MGKNIEDKELGEGLSQRKADGYYSARFTKLLEHSSISFPA